MIYIFLDTNIFLHFRFFIEIPWHDLFGEPYQIVLAPVVVDELDKHKRHPNGKIASRAKKVLARFESILSEPNLFSLQYLTKRPAPETFHRLQLDRQEQDDCILATIVEFSLINSEEEILFITNDTGPRFRASSLGIKTEQLPDRFLNPSEISDEQKQLQKLIQENNKLKNAMPKLSITFEDDTLHFKAKLNPIQMSVEEYSEPLFRDIVGLYTEMEYDDPEKKRQEIDEKLGTSTAWEEQLQLLSIKDDWLFNRVTKEQVETYNNELKDFFTKYRIYLEKDYKFNRFLSLTLPIDLKMHNIGNAPADDIDIWLHFPDGFKLLNEDDFPDKPKKPNPPRKPKGRYDFDALNYSSLPDIHSWRNEGNLMPDINFNKPEIRKTNSYEVDIHYKNLKHFQSVTIDPLLVIYPSVSKIINFTIDYKIIVGNFPEPFVGSLSVVAETD